MVILNPALNKALQLAEVIKGYIKEQKLQQGDKLPPIAQLARLYSVGKDSINEAMSLLSYEGVVVIKPRHGVYVAGNAWNSLCPMTPDWHDFAAKAPQKTHSDAYTKLSQRVIGAKGNMRSLGQSAIHSRIFPDFVKNGLIKAGELSAKRDLDTWFLLELPLREKLCEYMESYGLYVSPEQVMVMTGGVDALAAICVSTMYPGMELIYGAPNYTLAKKHLASYGITMTGVEMDMEGISKGALLNHLKNGPKKMLYLTPSFSLPTGITTSLRRREELLKICQNTKTPIIEVDSDRELSNNLPKPIAAIDNSDSVIYVGSIDRILPVGYQISWAVVPQSIADRFYTYRSQNDYVCRTTELFFYSILESGDFYRYREEYFKFLTKRKVFTERILAEYLGDVATWNSNGHPLVYWIRMNDNVNIEKLYEADDLFLYRGSEYGPQYDRYLTISSMNFSRHSFIKAIKRISEIAQL